MKKIRIAAIGAAMAVSFAAVADAQEPRSEKRGRPEAGERPGMRQGQDRSQMLFRGITLTEAQQEQVRVIRERHRDQMVEQRRQMMGERGEGRRAPADSAARAQMRTAMEARSNQHRAELRAVLTPEQAVIFDRNVAELRERVQQRQGRRPGPGARGGQRPQRGR